MSRIAERLVYAQRARVFAMTALVTGVLAAPAAAETITVTSQDDLFAPAGGPCSLRQAIQAANTDAAFGGCVAGSGADTVEIPAGTYVFTRAGISDDTNVAGDLDIAADLTLTGAGASTTTIDANGIDRAVEVRPGRSATIRGVTVTGGQAPNGKNGANETGATGANVSADSGNDGAPGGGIFNNVGSLTVVDSVISGNTAGAGGTGGNARGGDGALGNPGGNGGRGTGGGGGNGGDGGGIFTTGALTLTRVVVTGNTAGSGGRSGNGTGGPGGPAPAATGGEGGGGTAGIGGEGGDGGGVAEAAGGSLNIDMSSITSNAAGAGGPTGSATGGIGGVTGANAGQSGPGGSGNAGIAGSGGDGGGVSASDPAAIARSLIAANTSGEGGNTGVATGGKGGDSSGNAATSGDGGFGNAGIAGRGGVGGGLFLASGSVANVTLNANVTGGGGDAGPGSGGAGGNAVNVAGDGGPGAGGISGSGGLGGAIAAAGASALAVNHATISANVLGGGGAIAGGVGGSGGNGGTDGASGSVFAGVAGTAGEGGATQTLNGGATSLTIANSVLAANATPGCSGPFTDGAHNIALADATCPGANADPLLGPLADNGGPTQTRALGVGSPAIDAVPSGAGCTATDQRGAVRPQGAGCDAGAYEVAPPTVDTGGTSALATTTATVTGSVNPNARPTTFHFDFGPTPAYGSTTPATTAGNGVEPVDVNAPISALTPRTTTHYRLVASNADGTTVGPDQTIKTPAFGVGIETRKTKVNAARKARVKLSCPVESLISCSGKLTLTAKIKIRAAKVKPITVGKARFQIAAGSTEKLLVGIKKKAAGLIGRAGRKGLKVTATAAATDVAGNPGTTKARLKVKRGKRK